jgi:hypothetical protein
VNKRKVRRRKMKKVRKRKKVRRKRKFTTTIGHVNRDIK